MRHKVFSSVFVFVAFLSLFTFTSHTVATNFSARKAFMGSLVTKVESHNVSTVPLPIENNQVSKPIYPPYFQNNSFFAFREAVAYKESRGQYDIVNSLGYLGKYQFGSVTLRGLGFDVTSQEFLNNPSIQEEAFIAYLKFNHRELQPYIERYEGKVIGGVEITASGILAAAHLGGTGGVKRYLSSGGGQQTSDAYGSTVRSYIKKFGGYRIDSIVKS
jgi:hypothetical protein